MKTCTSNSVNYTVVNNRKFIILQAKRIVKYSATICDSSKNAARKPQLIFSSSFKQTVNTFKSYLQILS